QQLIGRAIAVRCCATATPPALANSVRSRQNSAADTIPRHLCFVRSRRSTDWSDEALAQLDEARPRAGRPPLERRDGSAPPAHLTAPARRARVAPPAEQSADPDADRRRVLRPADLHADDSLDHRPRRRTARARARVCL